MRAFLKYVSCTLLKYQSYICIHSPFLIYYYNILYKSPHSLEKLYSNTHQFEGKFKRVYYLVNSPLPRESIYEYSTCLHTYGKSTEVQEIFYLRVSMKMKNLPRDKNLSQIQKGQKTLRDRERVGDFITKLFTYKYIKKFKNTRSILYNITVVYFLIKVSWAL